MKNEFIRQYGHTWRVFERLVNDFDEDAWLHTGRKTITPARLSFHILKAVKYYLEDKSTILFESGKSFDIDWETAQENDLPSQKDIVACIGGLKEKTEKWLSEMDYSSPNKAFQWAGETKLGAVIFLLRHTIYHLGELSSLLNECKKGNAEDNFVKGL
jgi:hypothetical protein